MQIVTRFPVVDVEGTLVTLTVGKPEAEFGDEVSVEAVFDHKTVENLYVAGIDTAPAHEIVPEVLALFGLTDTESLVRLLSRKYGTALPATVPVTIYTFVDVPVEDIALSEED